MDLPVSGSGVGSLFAGAPLKWDQADADCPPPAARGRYVCAAAYVGSCMLSKCIRLISLCTYCVSRYSVISRVAIFTATQKRRVKLPDYRAPNPDMSTGFLDSVIETVENVINVIS